MVCKVGPSEEEWKRISREEHHQRKLFHHYTITDWWLHLATSHPLLVYSSAFLSSGIHSTTFLGWCILNLMFHLPCQGLHCAFPRNLAAYCIRKTNVSSHFPNPLGSHCYYYFYFALFGFGGGGLRYLSQRPQLLRSCSHPRRQDQGFMFVPKHLPSEMFVFAIGLLVDGRT